MIPFKFLLNNHQDILINLQKRRYPISFIKQVQNSFQEAQKLQIYEQEQQKLQQERNTLTKQGVSTKNQVILLNEKILDLEKSINALYTTINEILPLIPNFLDVSVPDGDNEHNNVELYKWGVCTITGKNHYHMGLIGNGSSMTCSRFIFLKGQIATLERALGNFLINFLINKGFQEVSIPHMLSEDSLYRTGHFPKDKENMFHIPDKNLYLIPTSECVLLNLLADTTLKEEEVPLKYTAFNVNFRKEAGAAGKDTRGLIRLHQFPKVEMVAFTTVNGGEDMFKHFLQNGEEALRLLELPYRVINLCSGDIGFNAKKQYDLEVWMRGAGEYREVSSISYCGDFQAQKLNCKYTNKSGEKLLLHTLNGTCLGVGRILAAIMEQYYHPDGYIRVPEVLHKYTDFHRINLIDK